MSHGHVLIREPGDAGEIAFFHRRAVPPEAVVDIAQRSVLLIEVFPDRLPRISARSGYRASARGAPGDEVERGIGVVHRHIDVRHVAGLLGGISGRWRHEHRLPNIIVHVRVGDGPRGSRRSGNHSRCPPAGAAPCRLTAATTVNR